MYLLHAEVCSCVFSREDIQPSPQVNTNCYTNDNRQGRRDPQSLPPTWRTAVGVGEKSRGSSARRALPVRRRRRSRFLLGQRLSGPAPGLPAPASGGSSPPAPPAPSPRSRASRPMGTRASVARSCCCCCCAAAMCAEGPTSAKKLFRYEGIQHSLLLLLLPAAACCVQEIIRREIYP